MAVEHHTAAEVGGRSVGEVLPEVQSGLDDSQRELRERCDALETTRIGSMEALRNSEVFLKDLRRQIVQLGAERDQARKKLAQLTTRGPGGRFVKVDSASGTSSGEIGH